MLDTIMVAVAVPCSPPPQHSPMLGQRASSQTVCRLRFLNCSLSSLNFLPLGIDVFNQGGNLNLELSAFVRFNLPLYSFQASELSSSTGLGLLMNS
jgi:hypothetical protein